MLHIARAFNFKATKKWWFWEDLFIAFVIFIVAHSIRHHYSSASLFKRLAI
jgi:hypothetical protein